MTTETNQTEETKPTPHMLTVLVDLSHPQFASRGLMARIALHEVLAGLARTALQGADATIVQDDKGKTVAVYSINPDPQSEGMAAFTMLVKNVLGEDSGYVQTGEEVAAVIVPRVDVETYGRPPQG